TVAPAARAALPTRKSRRVRLTAPPQMPLTHAADQVRGRPAQACWCPRCLREQETPKRDSRAPTGLEQLVPDIERRFVQPGAALDHSKRGVQLRCRQRAVR